MTGADESTFRLFVYGTLLRGGVRARHLAGQRFLQQARTVAGYALYHLGSYPGLVPSGDDGTVAGELYEVEQSLLPTLDRIEGAPDLYQLRSIELQGVAGPTFTYVYQRDVSDRPRIADGMWTHEAS